MKPAARESRRTFFFRAVPLPDGSCPPNPIRQAAAQGALKSRPGPHR